MTELLELIKDLWWCSEIDAPWKLETRDNLAPIESNDLNTVDFDKFFRKATQSQSWYGEQENKEVEQYQSLVQWLKNKVTNLRVYQIRVLGFHE